MSAPLSKQQPRPKGEASKSGEEKSPSKKSLGRISPSAHLREVVADMRMQIEHLEWLIEMMER